MSQGTRKERGRGVRNDWKGKRKRCQREQERKEEGMSKRTRKERGIGIKENKKGKRCQKGLERESLCVKYVLSVYSVT